MKISRPTRPSARSNKNKSHYSFISFASFFQNPPCLPVNLPRRARPGQEGGWDAYFYILRRKTWRPALAQSRAGLPHSTLGALQAESPHEPGGGPEQEVDLNKKKKSSILRSIPMRSSSVWRGASILPFWSVSTARKASGPSPPGRQNRPAPQPKKSRTFPPGNALLYIATVNGFFQTRRTFRGAPFFCPPVQAVTACPARPSGTVSDRGQPPDSTPRRKRKIRTLLLLEKSSDFVCACGADKRT